MHSDCWKSYSCLEAEEYSHFTVNHSKEFVNTETGAHTQTIESTWHALKSSLPKSGAVFMKGLSQVLDLSWLYFYTKVKPKTWLRPFREYGPWIPETTV